MKRKVFIIVIVTIITVVAGIIVFWNISKSTDNNKNSNDLDEFNENTLGIPERITEGSRTIEDVTIEVIPDTITNQSVQIQIIDKNGDKYAWSAEFGLQQKKGEEWKDLQCVSDEMPVTSISYKLNENEPLIQELDIEKYYGKLPKGIYRIVKTAYDREGSIEIYSNEFERK